MISEFNLKESDSKSMIKYATDDKYLFQYQFGSQNYFFQY